jgi:hypothetical protein
MAAKKKTRRGAKKKVQVHLDADVLRNLAKALEILAAMANVIEQAADDTTLRRELLKKKGAKGRRKK